MIRAFALVWIVALGLPGISAAETVRFSAMDGVEITGQTGGGEGPVIVLFHMAGASRGEYRDIAPRLHDLGYRTLAVDQRSGNTFNGVKNETVDRIGHDSGYAEAIPDLEAAMAYARETMGADTAGVMGSSYSASLVLVLAGRSSSFADAVMSFSPGEYFSNRNFVRDAAQQITAPVFLTAARSEMTQVNTIAEVIPTTPTVFEPNGAGRHGATTLVSADGAEYWAALQAFLAKHLPTH